jgi:hypothetical protein
MLLLLLLRVPMLLLLLFSSQDVTLKPAEKLQLPLLMVYLLPNCSCYHQLLPQLPQPQHGHLPPGQLLKPLGPPDGYAYAHHQRLPGLTT